MEEKINSMLNGDDTYQDNMLNRDLDNKPVVNAVDSLDPYLIAGLINDDKIGNNDPKLVSPILLAYVGDSVYDLIIRTSLVLKGNRQVAKLNRDAVLLVSAKAQSGIADIILPMLSEEEVAIYKRGVNSKPNTKSKNASFREYLKATGFETLIGYLYLSGRISRIMELVKTGVDGLEQADANKEK